MASLPRLAMISALLATLAFAATADAHVLKKQRASKANRTFAGILCADKNDPEGKCVSAKPGGCRRVSVHRVRCLIFITVEAEDKSQARCRALIEWILRKRRRSMRPSFLGIRSCAQVKPPENEPVQ